MAPTDYSALKDEVLGFIDSIREILKKHIFNDFFVRLVIR